MSYHFLIRVILLTLLLAFVLTGCFPGPPPEETVPGPESSKLLPASKGYVLFERPYGGGISAIELPSLKETIVTPDPPQNTGDRPDIHAISGPDQQGWIAYIEDHYFVANRKDRRHSLKVIRIDGTQDTTLFTRPGDAMWAASAARHGEIGHNLALSPTGGRIAFVSGVISAQMPRALLKVGSVEIWDAQKGTGIKTEIKALDNDAGRSPPSALAWLPDGKHLAYARLIPPKAAVRPGGQAEAIPAEFDGWDRVPAIFVRDVDAGTELFLHVGYVPLVAVDGLTVLIDGRYVVDVATGKSTPVTCPGGWPFAMVEKDVAVSWSLPTQGAKVTFTDNNSPIVGPKERLALKLTRLNSNEFQTVLPSIDPRANVSFGQVKDREQK